jgi:hypothetical protein
MNTRNPTQIQVDVETETYIHVRALSSVNFICGSEKVLIDLSERVRGFAEKGRRV